MAYQGIFTGTSPNDNTGDSLLEGAIKINSNFEEIYAALGDGTTINAIIEPDGIDTGSIVATGLIVNGDVDLGINSTNTISANGRFDTSLVPATNLTLDLGTSDYKWGQVYADGIDTGSIVATGLIVNGDVDLGIDSTNTISANGDVDLGIDSTNTISANGRFDTSLVPATNLTLDLGTSDYKWGQVYADGLNGYIISSSGVVATPGIRFASDSGTGFYRVGENIFGFASNRVKLFEVGRNLRDGARSFLWGTTVKPTGGGINSINYEGLQITQRGKVNLGQSSRTCIVCNRMTTDGQLITFEGQGRQEGDIRVDGTSISLTGGHLSRWSQLPGNASRIQILRGSVLTNVNEMCEWGDEDNEQLNRMEVSTVEGDVNVAGVFQCWDDDDEVYTKDLICAMTGDFVIRIAQGTVVSRGDLLMSAGDGTAKPQGDDIVRSKTIAKVTSTVVSTTYDDGSYCVPCVLMAC